MTNAANNLPLRLHNAAQIRAMDRYAIEQLGIPGYTLMSRAGIAAWECLHASWPDARRITVICGSGNNAGDGYVLARVALRAGLQVTVVALAEPSKLQGDAMHAWQDFAALGGQVEPWSQQALSNVDVIVDAIFGIGLSRPLDKDLCERIAFINSARVPVLALDIPTGLSVDTGHVFGAAIHAERTITFIGLKIGCYVGEGPDYAGRIEFSDLAVPAIDEHQTEAIAERIDTSWLRSFFTHRRRTSHKGMNGHVLIIGGSRDMGGAVRLTGEACLRAGAGLVTVATAPENVAPIVSARPELIVRGIATSTDLRSLIAHADVIAVGPGLGTDERAREFFNTAMACDKPLVVDADALNLLSAAPSQRANWVLTPHPGEAGRLIGRSTVDIQNDRLGAARSIAEQFGGVCVLKGAGTLVMKNGELPAICDRGNPGMATAGMGDVLTGVIAAIAAQFDGDLLNAAKAGVLTHALAGDLAARSGERGLIASDVIDNLRACVNP